MDATRSRFGVGGRPHSAGGDRRGIVAAVHGMHIFGLLVATALTLFVLPVLYYMVARRGAVQEKSRPV